MQSRGRSCCVPRQDRCRRSDGGSARHHESLSLQAEVGEPWHADCDAPCREPASVARDVLLMGAARLMGRRMAPNRSTVLAVWNGTTEELRRLTAAVEHNCSCVVATFGSPGELCGAHRMLVDQRSLDHLLFVFRTVHAFVRAELRDDSEGAEREFADAALQKPGSPEGGTRTSTITMS
jgi:hypothetical protein